MEIRLRSRKNESGFKVNNLRQHHKRVSQCTACGGPLAQSRITFKTSDRHNGTSTNNNVYYYSKNLTNNTLTSQNCVSNDSKYLKQQEIKNSGDIQPPIKITTTNHVKQNNVCVKYVNTPLPKTEHFHISPKCVKRKLWSFTYNILPQKFKHIFAKKDEASKFDRCRPMIVSLECKCDGKEKMHITKKLEAHTLLDKNIILPKCNCESSIKSNLDNKSTKKGEHLCTNGCAELFDNAINSHPNKNSFCFMLITR